MYIHKALKNNKESNYLGLCKKLKIKTRMIKQKKMVIIDNHNLQILLVMFSLNLIIQLFIKKLVHVFVKGIPYQFLRTGI